MPSAAPEETGRHDAHPMGEGEEASHQRYSEEGKMLNVRLAIARAIRAATGLCFSLPAVIATYNTANRVPLHVIFCPAPGDARYARFALHRRSGTASPPVPPGRGKPTNSNALMGFHVTGHWPQAKS